MSGDHKPTLEDLLKLKRAERPNPEFWERFERELHEKNMQVLIKTKRNRMADFMHSARRVLVPMVPVGAAAIVALTFLLQGSALSPNHTSASFESSLPLAQVGSAAARPSHFVANVLASSAEENAISQTFTSNHQGGVRYSSHSLGASSFQGGVQESIIF
ncbi:MAG TPA: hypothetical protein DIU37_03625 [Opitutae bacterium]|nr:hypothetical protein [Opitutae bacterium]|tara:strand:+ start:266 stop:745 length:480 start_codon:yes stop_codon:yes gene_type:complete